MHSEDPHNAAFYGSFFLYGRLGNPGCATPLWSCASLLSSFEDGATRARVVEGMKLPYLHRPGAGRVDDAAERLVTPLLDTDWAGRCAHGGALGRQPWATRSAQRAQRVREPGGCPRVGSFERRMLTEGQRAPTVAHSCVVSG